MFFKFIFTDQEEKIKGFTISSESKDTVLEELEGFFKEQLVPDGNEAKYRAVLYNLTMPNEGEDEDAFIDNITNPEHQEHFKTWFLSSKEPYEEKLSAFLEQRSVFALLGY